MMEDRFSRSAPGTLSGEGRNGTNGTADSGGDGFASRQGSVAGRYRLGRGARLRGVVVRWLPMFFMGGLFAWFGTALVSGEPFYDWQWYRVWRFLGRWTAGGFVPGLLLEGLIATLEIAGAGLLVSVVAGLGAGLLRLSPWPTARGLAGLYVGCIRNTPLLLQLFFVYFLLAPVLDLGPFGSAVLALGIFEGAYVAELVRAGVLAVPRTQWEAGISLGFGPATTLRLIILPQAMRLMLPSLTNQLVSLIKDTSLVSAIAVADLTMRAQEIIADTFLTFEIWLLVAGLYLLLALLVSLPIRWLELRRGGR